MNMHLLNALFTLHNTVYNNVRVRDVRVRDVRVRDVAGPGCAGVTVAVQVLG